MTLADATRQEIEKLISTNDVVLFMKGNRAMPQCGFSAAVIEILDEYLPGYETVNVLANQDVREGIKEFSDWPTIPQLYVKGEFVGGADIVREMHTTGELSTVLGKEVIPVDAPSVTITDSAMAALVDAKSQEDEYTDLRLDVSARFQYGLSFGPAMAGDVVVEKSGLTVRMDRGSARRAHGMTIDFVDGAGGAGFKLDNPNEPPKVKQLPVTELKAMIDGGKTIAVFDVRPDQERAIASLDFAEALTEAKAQEIMALDKTTPIAFLCRSGQRSMAAAEHFLQSGFSVVYNVKGGILAWSDEVDSSVTKY